MLLIFSILIVYITESGPDTRFNSKLLQLVSKAKASYMPKEKIEASIKNALRVSFFLLHRMLN